MHVARTPKPRALSIEQVSEFVTRNLARALTVRQLGRLAGLSEFHFIRAFRAATGRHLTSTCAPGGSSARRSCS